VVAGIIGAKYGPFIGGILNVLSSTLAAGLLFVLVRLVFQEQGIRLLAKFKRVDQFTTLMERNAFFAVLLARLIPFVPAAFVNVYTAISRMRVGTFVAATLIGKIPVMFVFAQVILEADHMPGMKGATAEIVSTEPTTVYMVDYTPTTGGAPVKNQKWVTESELSTNAGSQPNTGGGGGHDMGSIPGMKH
jgi:uncharacterized membrane protein YdjX (TVP38/TMEM64 family)